MKTRFLLPNKFKKWGAFMAPLGFCGWWWAQRHFALFTDKSIRFLFLFLAFCIFMTGLFLLVFVKEKTEDEYSQKIRLESFQFAAITQFLFYFLFLVGAVADSVINEDPTFSSFVINQLPISLILLFWILYFVRFNFVLHFKKQKEQLD